MNKAYGMCPKNYALTATGDVLVVYLQQFWKTVSKVSDTKDTIKFKMDSKEITYIVDMFCDTLKLLVETLDNLFIAPVNIKVIESFMQTVGYQGVVDKVSAFYTKFLAQPWQTMFKVFNRCLTTRTSGGCDYLRTTPKANRIPTLTSGSLVGKKRKQVQEKLAEEEIKKMVEGEEDEESYASTFAVSMLNDNVDDFGTRIEPKSHMGNLEVVDDDDDVNDKEKQDGKKDDDDQPKDDDVEKMDDAAEEKDNNDHTDHILVGTHATGSMETRNEQMQT
ncbi:hypothetical protein Tco_1104868 [Tanacetum coccineum]